jgi:hypothetical protein
VTRISIEGTMRGEITMRSGPLIHKDHESLIRVDEDHNFVAKVRNGKITTIPVRVNPTMQVNLNKIGGLLLHGTAKLPVAIDGFYQRM